MSEANQDPVLMQVKDGVATITLNRPNAMNTMNIELLDALLSSLEIATSDPHCRVIVLTGAGNVFCAGGDLVLGLETINGPGPLAAQTGRLRRFMRVSQLLHECDAITVAAVNGACAGGGLSIACACDLRVASSNAKFNAGFQSVGVSGDFGITWLLPRLVGEARARRMLFTPSNLSAEDALSIGLVDEVVPEGESLNGAMKLASKLISYAPLALKATKRNLLDASRVSLTEHLEREAARQTLTSTTADSREGIAAFLAKRSPVFSRS